MAQECSTSSTRVDQEQLKKDPEIAQEWPRSVPGVGPGLRATGVARKRPRSDPGVTQESPSSSPRKAKEWHRSVAQERRWSGPGVAQE